MLQKHILRTKQQKRRTLLLKCKSCGKTWNLHLKPTEPEIKELTVHSNEKEKPIYTIQEEKQEMENPKIEIKTHRVTTNTINNQDNKQINNTTIVRPMAGKP